MKNELGTPIALGRTAEIYAWGEGQVLKLFRAWASTEMVDDEARVHRAVQALGLPIPAAGEIIEIEGRRGILYQRVDGPTMLRQIQSRLWQISRLARLQAELHVQMHACAAPGLPSMRERLRWKIQHAGPLSDNQKLVALAALDRLPDGDCLCHGDFHPDNILMTGRGPVIIDWMDATCGHPLADVARSSLLMQAGGLPPGHPFSWLLQLVRGAFYRTYLHRYFELRPNGQENLADWLPVIAAARLSEDIPSERQSVLAMVEAGFSAKIKA